MHVDLLLFSHAGYYTLMSTEYTHLLLELNQTSMPHMYILIAGVTSYMHGVHINDGWCYLIHAWCIHY